ncbi:MAG: rod shape-determining protein RodA [Candidatus Buchananbacteria bacterium RIFCSPHIGHO2_02_FULL_45_11b]|uniref:Rod shape-determining protein RodA n=3 Tax=Candidatus Buchananiibacteriota TaxID=1817903 RepID=A0A1G1YPE9_9BACT|nr:MAG: rod shape-determining protein RodA [Candidatus Buchananbacteria bacterium RIFCSPHIGHO2_02_FULL_45_11b]OGY54235.1 MAG: rod shape-determining protein RodA [Candidatus Buchananbacteria bacterium RIFCSPLOWO2_01_FULL_45_31]OGY57175.1 MAG: rod shape-determining protein RodA [Candidatus Buchananbacteria bacterium RIFCSPLOWO2_02_FULL_46_11b]
MFSVKKYFTGLKSFDWVLFGAVFLLVCFGLAAIYSISISSDQPDFGNFSKQIIFFLIGLGFLFSLSFFNYHYWHDYGLIFYFAAAGLLVLVLFFGLTVHGTSGWFNFFGFNFQPVELAKVALIVVLARFLSQRASAVKELKTFYLSAALAGWFFLLVILQPDFGSAVILFLIWFFLVLLAGVNKKYLIISILILLFGAALAWFFFFQDYQRDRILTFLNPQADPYNRGYQVRQAITAVGAGGLFGRGLGFGSQSQLKFIPASQTDFIFAVIAEELGFLGVGLVLFFFFLLFYRLIRAAKLMRDNFSVFFILGVSALLFSHLAINVGMNVGLAPVTGISLPFLSYGGSFLVACLILIGVVENMLIRNRG